MNKKQLFIAILVTVIYMLLTLNTVLHHETWADEAQVWQLCRNLSIPDLYNHLKNEGHPILFYLLVMPFAKVFSNIIYMQLICWIFMCASVFLLMYYAPFKLYTKLAIILSAGFIYFFPVIARNYSIIPFLIFAAAILNNKTKEHPILYAIILTMLANTHIIMSFFTLCLAIRFYYLNILLNIRNKNKDNIISYIISCVIIFIGFLLLFLNLNNTTNSNAFLYIDTSNLVLATKRILCYFFINAYDYDISLYSTLQNPILDLSAIAFSIILYILIFINLLVNNKKLFLIAFTSIGFQLCIYIFAYNSFVYVNRIFCAHIILIFCYWLLLEKDNFKSKYRIWGKTAANIILALFFALTIYNGFHYTKMDIELNYSGAKETSEFIKNNIDKNSVILVDNEPYMISLVYYLKDDYKIYSVFRRKYLKYVIWDNVVVSNFADLGWCQYVDYLRETDKRKHYVINIKSDIMHKLSETHPEYFKLIFISGKAMEPYEGYRIYEFIK